MSDSRLEYITKQVLPKLKEKWKNARDMKFEPMIDKKGEEHFQSVAMFGDIVIENNKFTSLEKKSKSIAKKSPNDQLSGNTSEHEDNFLNERLNDVYEERLGVVIKMQICDHLAMSWTNGGLNFFNEIYFYSEIVPYFSSKIKGLEDIVPEILYGYFSDNNRREEDIIVLKNLHKDNYRLAKARTVLSLEHVLLALRKLGKFHACSYVTKSLDRASFVTKLDSLKSTKVWIHDSKNRTYEFFKKSGDRPISYVETLPEYKTKLSKLKDYFDNIQTNVSKIYAPDEKMGVLCHGDFNRNNMFFKYETISLPEKTESKAKGNGNEKSQDQQTNISNEESVDASGTTLAETPIDVKFFDWADVIYASPVLDLAFFLFMNTSQTMRLAHWDTMIRVYHDAVKAESEQFENVTVPSYQDICDEFKLNSMMALIMCSFFLPMMMGEKVKDRSEWTEAEEEKQIGGDEATKAVGEILMFMLDKGFI